MAIMEIVSGDGHQDLRDMMQQMEVERKRKQALRQAADALGGQGSPGDLDSSTARLLQAAQDRRSKFIDALSNLLKKQEDTADDIIKNLK